MISLTEDADLNKLLQGIVDLLGERREEFNQLLAAFDRVRAHSRELEKQASAWEVKVTDSKDLTHRPVGDVEDENEELRKHVAYLSDLLVRICGFAESDQADDADRWRAFFKEVERVAKGTMSMRSDAWLQTHYVEMQEYQRVCDEGVVVHEGESKDEIVLDLAFKTLWFSDEGWSWCPECDEKWQSRNNRRHPQGDCKWSMMGPHE